jgi:hypothetical protein
MVRRGELQPISLSCQSCCGSHRALAHAVSDKVEAAYRRGDLFDKRRRLMEAWAEFCEHGTVTADVVPLRA